MNFLFFIFSKKKTQKFYLNKSYN